MVLLLGESNFPLMPHSIPVDVALVVIALVGVLGAVLFSEWVRIRKSCRRRGII